jgi:cytochrome oxidase Cu insertion factor (SCO1/SenC/PrrC family)
MLKYLLSGLIVTIALLLTLSGCRSAPAEPEERADAGSGQLSVGDTALDFILPAATGGEVSLSRLREQQDVLLYFNMAYG